ncbi:zinc finger protein AZF3-like [Phoenix dactylifera]|uniref:Zinc finger protein AZF3-like n=1 Tax=Phoenix dactylifera TaxID=42345 RepID=A0A8B7C0I2_PHODC|nr:zinc finger protein AZF3-like [Phoenix dactylifera]
MTQTETPSPPLITWSLTGKRGRRSPQPRRTHHEPESQERDIARFLLALSSPSPSSSHGGGEEAVVDGEGSGSDGSGRRKRRRRRVTTRVRVHECSLCPKRFRTGQALGGHMKSHWERDLQGRVVKKKTRKLSSLLALGLGLGFGLELDVPSPSPPNPKSPGFSLEGRERDEEYGGESLAEEDSSSSSPPAPLLLPC